MSFNEKRLAWIEQFHNQFTVTCPFCNKNTFTPFDYSFYFDSNAKIVICCNECLNKQNSQEDQDNSLYCSVCKQVSCHFIFLGGENDPEVATECKNCGKINHSDND